MSQAVIVVCDWCKAKTETEYLHSLPVGWMKTDDNQKHICSSCVSTIKQRPIVEAIKEWCGIKKEGPENNDKA